MVVSFSVRRVNHWLVQYDPSSHPSNQHNRFLRGHLSLQKIQLKLLKRIKIIKKKLLLAIMETWKKKHGFSNTSFEKKTRFFCHHHLRIEFSGTFRPDDVTLLAPSCLPLCLEDPDMTWNNGQWKTLRSPRCFTGSIVCVGKLPHPKVKMCPENMQRKMHSSSDIFQPSYLRDKLAVSWWVRTPKGSTKIY